MATKLLGMRAGHRPLRDDSTSPQAGDPIAIVTPNQPQAAFGALTGDIMVHDHVEGSQWEPVIAALTGGNYAVAWFQQGLGADKLYVRIFNNAGVPQTGEILVANDRVVFDGEDMFDMRVSIAATDDGGMVLAWVNHDIVVNTGSGPTYSGETHVFAQRVSGNGSLVGGQIEVAVAPTFSGSPVYMNPSVGAFPGGGFFVTFNDSDGLNGRIFGANNAGGTQFLLTTNEVGYRDEQSIATLTNGSLIAVWEAAIQSPGQPAQAVIEARFITPSGPGALFTIGSASPGAPFDVAVAALAGGGFVATWVASVEGQTDVYAQIYTATGSASSGVFRVNAYVPGSQSDPNVIGMPDGGFVISYGSLDSVEPLSAGIYAQRFSATGSALGSAFRVNDAIDGDQYQGYQESVEVLSNGNIVFGWMTVGISGGPANDTFNTYMRIFPGDQLPPGPATGDIPVADHGTADQSIPVVAALAGGGYAAAWFQEGGGQEDKLFVRLFDNGGVPRGAAIEVFSGELNFFNMDFFHMRVSIAATDDGGFVLAWVDHDVVYHPNEPVIFTGETHVYAQRFTSTGATLGPKVDVADAPVGSGSPLTMNPAVSALPGGAYLVIYDDRVGPGDELTGRIINAAGVGGTPFALSSTGGGAYSLGQYSTTTLADGRLAVAWTMENNSQALADQLHVRFVTASGPGTEFQVDIPGEEDIGTPAIGALANGGFVVAWSGGVVGASDRDLYAQIFSATGSPVGSVFRVNTYTPYGQDDPSIVGMPDGGFVISYQSPDSIEPFSSGIFAQRFSATGQAVGGAYRVNDATADSQFQFIQEGVDVLSNGNLVFGWLTQGVSGNDPDDAYTRIFSGDYVPTGPIGGTTGSDILIGTAGNDTIDALGGNDVLFGGGGNDSLDGGTGTDIADYTGLQSDYRVTVSNGVYTIVDLRAGSPDGTDTLRNIEQLRFNGGTPVNIQDAVAPDPGAGVPAGGEVRGNATVTGTQSQPAVAALSGGGFVMLWEDSAQDGSGTGIFARRFGADGAPIGNDFVIPTTTADDQRNPMVAGLADGGFLAVWESRNSGYDILARRFAADGTPQGAAFTVNTTLPSSQTAAAVAASASHFAIVWQTITAAETTDIVVRLYNANGTAATGEVAVNTTTANNQSMPAIAMLAGGGFVVTWESEGQDGSGTGIYARRFDAAGVAVGTEFLVNNVTAGSQRLPAVAALTGGGFVIVWNDTGVHGRLYGADGQPAGAQFDVAASAGSAGVTALAGGGFAVSWTGAGTGLDVFARIYDASGATVGSAFPVNETLAGNQSNGGPGSLAQLVDGTLAFAWSGNGTGDADGVFTRRFSIGAGPGPQPITGSDGPDVLNGTAGDDEIHGLGGNDTLNGLGGNDILDGGAGADRMAGGPGDDLYYVDEAGDIVIELAGEGNDRVIASVSYTLGGNAHVERLEAAAGTAAINLIGNYLSQTIVGNAGNNVLHGGGGLDVLVGGGGNDIYYTDVAGTTVVEAAGEGSDTLYTSVSYVLGAGVSVETLSANNYAATTPINLTGNAFSQRIVGNAGANILNGGGGADQLFGRAGDDTYIVDAAATLVVEYAGEGNDTIITSVTYVLDGNASVETLQTSSATATGAINLTGNHYGQTIIGNAGANVLHGGGGTDTLRGLGGNDIYYTDEAATTIYEAAGGGADRVYSSVSYSLLAGQEIEFLSANNHGATSAINLTGNEFANLLHGNQGANVLDGKGGNDTLVGLGGADRFQFTTALGPGNVDTILDFVSGTDKIALDDAVFTAIGGLGALNPGAFATGSAAQDASDRIVYNQTTGQLFYDADGNGAGAAIHFATLTGAPALAASDFLVI